MAASKRAYDSPLRKAGAEATRGRLLDAAEALLSRRGYSGATLAAIAKKAGVAAPTLYATFGSKAELAFALVRRVKTSIGLAERFLALEREPDPVRKLRLSAEITVLYSREGWPVLEALRTLPPSEARLKRVWQDAEASRRRGQATIIDALAAAGRLRVPYDEALDVLYSLSSHETYRLYVHECGWAPDRFGTWLAETSERLLVA
jgi:AcrR family transcriptional regulator